MGKDQKCPTIEEFWAKVREEQRLPDGEYVGRMGLYHMVIGILRSHIDTDDKGNHIPDDSNWLRYLREQLLLTAGEIQRDLRSRSENRFGNPNEEVLE